VQAPAVLIEPQIARAGEAGGEAPVAALPRTVTARRIQEAICAFSSIGATANSCAAAASSTWRSGFASAVPLAVPVPLRTVVGKPAAGGGGDGGSSVASYPSEPSRGPGPAPGGASGGSAAGGAGSASPASMMLACLLLLAAPRAMRRLRLLQRSWRTSFFVLIPERPG
jgi:hypothetical protein